MSIEITYFVHGTTTDNELNISSGWNDVELSDLGIIQSIDLRKLINVKDFDAVFCSDFKRAVRSTEIVFETDVQIFQDSRLRECNYGDYNGKSSDIVEPMQEANIISPFPNGESYEDVKERVNDFLKMISEQYQGKKIAIVAHKAPQIVFDVLLKGKTWEQAFRDDWRKSKSWQPGWKYNLT